MRAVIVAYDAIDLHLSTRGGRTANQTVLPHHGRKSDPVGRWNSCVETRFYLLLTV